MLSQELNGLAEMLEREASKGTLTTSKALIIASLINSAAAVALQLELVALPEDVKAIIRLDPDIVSLADVRSSREGRSEDLIS